VVGCYECGDEPSGSGAMELVERKGVKETGQTCIVTVFIICSFVRNNMRMIKCTMMKWTQRDEKFVRYFGQQI
jgi:hypothetical protein